MLNMPRRAQFLWSIACLYFGWTWYVAVRRIFLSAAVARTVANKGQSGSTAVETGQTLLFSSPGILIFCIGAILLFRAITSRCHS